MIAQLYKKIVRFNDFNGGDYFKTLDAKDRFIAQNKLACDFTSLIEAKTVKPNTFIDYIQAANATDAAYRDNATTKAYKYYQVATNSEALDNYLANLLPDNFDHADIVKTLKDNSTYTFPTLLQAITNCIDEQNVNKDNIGAIFTTYRLLASDEERPLPVTLDSTYINQLHSELETDGRNAFEYFRKEGREELRQEVNAAFDRLAARYNPIVMEGAGSISEINLRDTDLVNMPMACYADADVILVADIDRGGVFASVYGSVMLQTPEDKKRIKGVIINKFRGDIRLFESGVKMMEDLCGIPVLGIIPYYRNIHIEEEDSVGLDYKRMQAVEGKINIAVVLLRHLSNFTDFNRLERDERVHLYYTNNTEDLAKADIILLPGSKSTLDDLYELRRNGVAQAVLRAHREGVTVMGICGGYQLMGLEIHDPEGVEGEIRQLPGLGLLPVITTMQGEKVTRQVNFHFLENAETCQGYEIHMGETRPVPGVSVVPLNRLEDGGEDGCFVNQKCMGSYIHGILDNQAFIDYLLEPYAEKLECHTVLDYRTYKEEQYDKLAEHVRSHLNLPLLYQIMSGND